MNGDSSVGNTAFVLIDLISAGVESEAEAGAPKITH